MIRRTGMIPVLCLIVLISGREARAQWGCIIGDDQPGCYSGQFYGPVWAAGPRMTDPRIPPSPNLSVQSLRIWNNYVAQAVHETTLRRIMMGGHGEDRLDDHSRRLREDPGGAAVEDGDALNLALDDLTRPALGREAREALSTRVPASLIAEVSFQHAADRIVFMLDELRGALWAETFEGGRFAADRAAYGDLVRQLRKQANRGNVSPETLRAARSFVDKLRAGLAAEPIPDPVRQREARQFAAAASALLGFLDEPDLRPAMRDLRTIKETDVGRLVDFMHTFNLRFGPATTDRQKQAYRRLFAILDGARDRVPAEARKDGKSKERAAPRQVVGILANFDRAGSS